MNGLFPVTNGRQRCNMPDKYLGPTFGDLIFNAPNVANLGF